MRFDHDIADIMTMVGLRPAIFMTATKVRESFTYDIDEWLNKYEDTPGMNVLTAGGQLDIHNEMDDLLLSMWHSDPSELARVMQYLMLLSMAVRYRLNHEQARKDFGIDELIAKYKPHRWIHD